MSDLRRDQPLFRGVDHPSIACNDVATLAGWYCQNLGMRVITNNGMTPPAMILGYGNDLSDGMLIEMIPAVAPGPAPDSINRLAPGLRHLAIRVADFDAAHARLKELGVKFTTEPSEALGGGRTGTLKATSCRSSNGERFVRRGPRRQAPNHDPSDL
jgi:glyoxylase I family protein